MKSAPGSTPDLVATLREIHRLADAAAKGLREGTVLNGHAALKKIELAARDGVRHGEALKELERTLDK